MSAASFDSNIVIDALRDHEPAQIELERVDDRWISRVTWIEVMSRVDETTERRTKLLLSAFLIDELDQEIAARAAMLRNERRSLKLADAVIFASALVRGRILVTRNTRDFPVRLPGIRVPYQVNWE